MLCPVERVGSTGFSPFFFINDTATTEIYTLSLHDALPIWAPYELVKLVAKTGKLPVPNFAAGGIATPADASLMMQLGAESVFVGSGIFKSGDPAPRARAIVQATTHYLDADLLAHVSENLGEPMVGINISTL